MEEYADWDRLLAERFPIRDAAEAEHAWAALQQQLAVGQAVTGVVVARAPFGAWVDLGIGFPALLEIIGMAGLTPERYQAGDWCPVGSEVTALVGGFRADGEEARLWQVRLWQVGDTPLLAARAHLEAEPKQAPHLTGDAAQVSGTS